MLYHGRNTGNNACSKAGFSLLELMIVVAIIGTISSIAIPNLLNSRTRAHEVLCAANRQSLERAEVVFLNNNNRHSDSIEELVSTNDSLYTYVRCPINGILFWVDAPEESPELVNTLVGCSRHGFDLSDEEVEEFFPEVVISDDFNGDLSAWTVAYGKWYVRDGILTGQNNYNMILTGDSLSDSSISTIVDFDGKKGSAAIVFRATTDSRGNVVSGYGLELNKSSKEFIFTKIVNGRYYEETFVDVPSSFNWSTSHDLEVSAVGDSFTFYVDGEEVLKQVDDSYSSGSVGLYSEDKRTTFQDFEVSTAK